METPLARHPTGVLVQVGQGRVNDGHIVLLVACGFILFISPPVFSFFCSLPLSPEIWQRQEGN